MKYGPNLITVFQYRLPFKFFIHPFVSIHPVKATNRRVYRTTKKTMLPFIVMSCTMQNTVAIFVLIN